MKTARRQYRQEYSMTVPMRNIVVAMMKRDGRDFNVCELCDAMIPGGKYELHHEKYEGATYYDLKIVCKKCNLAPENVGLT